MPSLIAVTLDQALRGLLTLFVLLAIAGLSAGCFSGKSEGRHESRPSARPAIAHDQSTGMYTWHFLAANGVLVHQSPMAFHSRIDLIAHYAEVRRLMVQAARPTTITRYPDDSRGFRWSLYDEATGKRLEVTDQPFASANAARTNYDTLRTAVLATPPQDLDETTIPF